MLFELKEGQEFIQLNNKVLGALKAHPDIIKEGVNVT